MIQVGQNENKMAYTMGHETRWKLKSNAKEKTGIKTKKHALFFGDDYTTKPLPRRVEALRFTRSFGNMRRKTRESRKQLIENKTHTQQTKTYRHNHNTDTSTHAHRTTSTRVHQTKLKENILLLTNTQTGRQRNKSKRYQVSGTSYNILVEQTWYIKSKETFFYS